MTNKIWRSSLALKRERINMFDVSSFAYDQQAPLEFTVLSERVQDGAVIQDITYASPHGGKVSAYLISPSQEKPQAGLIFGHWGEGNRTEFVEEAIVLTEPGIVSLCLDSPHRRPPEYEPQRTQPQAELQWIIDVRRGVDLLLDHFHLSPERLGYVGHSYGASYGGTIAGIEHRIKAYVLMAGWYSVSELTRTSMNPVLVEQRKKIPLDILNAYLDTLAPLDARHYIGHAAPSHLFFQFAHDDRSVSAEEGQCFFELASEPKQITWYENCGHELNTQARLDRVTWLCTQLGLPSPSQDVLDRLKQVPPPVPLERGN
jgi:cephalosporin-C deacetylase-like acetyl esterase